ncbi:thiaminase II [Rubrobacter aplysinae]|uniref:thiaminase II n=1 Tax=Rubrobacter aplysinae TaxID=909625 RepID=UPI00069DB96D|nr:thiaminase II [Rubrobacter aplysinae]
MRDTLPEQRTGFTAELWGRARPVYERILGHPFLAGLSDGTLSGDRFRHYVTQDALYLADYARALSLVGVSSGEGETLEMFNRHAGGAIVVERELHGGLLAGLGVSEGDAEPAPTTLAYTSYLLRTAALEPYPEALCAVLPCYWIYREVGDALAEKGSPEDLYDDWIRTYAGEDFDSLVSEVLDLTDRAGRKLSGPEREKAGRAFETAARYEWMFWNMGWTLEGWPVG